MNLLITLQDHPSARYVADEIHARPILPIASAARVKRVAALLDGAGEEFLLQFREWLAARGVSVPVDPSARRIPFTINDRSIVLELHTEFVTLTWSALPGDDRLDLPEGIGLETFKSLPLISRTRVDVVDAPRILEEALVLFDPISLCRSTAEGGTCELATDFVADRAGFTRYELAAGQLDDIGRGILVRRVLEIDTYRAMTLLGLPLAREKSRILATLEERLGAAVRASKDGGGDRLELLNELNGIHAAVSSERDACRYRFSASQAYGDVLRTRLTNLGEVANTGARSISLSSCTGLRRHWRRQPPWVPGLMGPSRSFAVRSMS